VYAILWLLATHDAGVVRAAEDKHRDQKIEEAKSDVATVRAEVSQYHDNLNSKLDKITDDVAYIRGRIDK
jgi:vacuolar-type H+-ATPase subunit I/STV1